MLGQMLLVSSTVCQMVSNSHIDSFIDTNCVMLCVVHLQGLDSDIFIVESSWELNALVLARCISMWILGRLYPIKQGPTWKPSSSR
jgi:hypothetical protein